MDANGISAPDAAIIPVLGVLQARVSSTRLPRKVLLDLAGKSVLEHTIERLRSCRSLDRLVVAIPLGKEDDILAEICEKLNQEYFRGSVEPLDRFYRAACHYRASNIVRLKSDCPLIDAALVDEVVARHLKEGNDYTGTTLFRSYPLGQDVEALTFCTLETVFREAKWFSEREHLTLYIAKRQDRFKIGSVMRCPDLSGMRWTIDHPEDYKLLHAIYQALYPVNPDFVIDDVLEFLENHPELKEINTHIPPDEGVQISLKNDRMLEE
jgi:spore coat polysaccharide biosynthesis protein SpsF (cytidylyltransferase family)